MTNIGACRFDYGTGVTVHGRLAEVAGLRPAADSAPPHLRVSRELSSDLDSLSSLSLCFPLVFSTCSVMFELRRCRAAGLSL